MITGVTTIGDFLASIDPATFYVLEKHQNADGYTTQLLALSECELDDTDRAKSVVIAWSSADSAVISHIVADGGTACILSHRAAFPTQAPQYEYPVSNRHKIMTHAAEQARCDDAWMCDCTSNEAETRTFAATYIDFEMSAYPVFTYDGSGKLTNAQRNFTDDVEAYKKLYINTYTYIFLQLVDARLKAVLDDAYGEQKDQF